MNETLKMLADFIDLLVGFGGQASYYSYKM